MGGVRFDRLVVVALSIVTIDKFTFLTKAEWAVVRSAWDFLSVWHSFFALVRVGFGTWLCDEAGS